MNIVAMTKDKGNFIVNEQQNATTGRRQMRNGSKFVGLYGEDV